MKTGRMSQILSSTLSLSSSVFMKMSLHDANQFKNKHTFQNQASLQQTLASVFPFSHQLHCPYIFVIVLFWYMLHSAERCRRKCSNFSCSDISTHILKYYMEEIGLRLLRYQDITHNQCGRKYLSKDVLNHYSKTKVTQDVNLYLFSCINIYTEGHCYGTQTHYKVKVNMRIINRSTL